MSAFLELTLVSVIISFVSVVITRLLTKPETIRKIKSEMEFHKKKSNEAQKSGDVKAAKEHMNKMMGASQQQFSHNMKPMMVTMVVIIAALGWITSTYGKVTVGLPFNFPLWGSDMGWFWWYVWVSFPINMAARKLLGVE